jgi:uncharacterized membrane protein YobD (UPF0266 family)
MPLIRHRITSETSFTNFHNLILKYIQYSLSKRVNQETNENNLLIAKADKGKMFVITNKDSQEEKVIQFINRSQINLLKN